MYSASSIIAEPVLQCPFNPSHSIAQSRIQKHIVKCEKNYPGDYKVMCPYNATHRVSGSEINDHILTCTQKVYVGQEFIKEPKQHGSLNFSACTEISSVIDCKENWELDSDSDSKCDSESDYVFDKSSMTNRTDMTYNALRPPLGYSEASMRDLDNASVMDDTQSITSGMAAGRGTPLHSEREIFLKKIQEGRGKSVA